MKVKNLNGTSLSKCNCNSWIEHWSKYSDGQPAIMCAVVGCYNSPSVGGHIQKDDNTDRNWYVVPLCGGCNNNKGQDLDIEDGINLVPANVSETCGKS